MPRQPDPDEVRGWTPIEDARNAANLFVFVMQAMAAPTEVIMRRRFGRNAFSWPSFAALFFIPAWMLFWEGYDPRPLWVFLWVFIAFQLRARIESILVSLGRNPVHSRYNGDSRLQWLERWVEAKKIKGGIEGFVVIFGGFLLMPVSEPLGSFIVVSGMCLMGSMSVIESVDRARTQQLYDAWLEQRYHAERFREMQRRGGR